MTRPDKPLGAEPLKAISGWHTVFPWLALVAGVLVTLLAWAGAQRYVEYRRHAEFERAVVLAQNDIQERVEAYLQSLLGVSGLLRTNPAVTRDAFRGFYESLDLKLRFPGIAGIGVVRTFTPDSLAAHERQMQAQGWPDYHVRPRGLRERYSAIVLIEPMEINQRGLGMDPLTEKTRQSAMDQARDSGQPAMSGKVQLFLGDDASNKNSVIIYIPTYRQGMVIDTPAQRRAALQGFAFAGFRMHEFMQGVFDQPDSDLDVQIFDGPSLGAEALLYASATSLPPLAVSHDLSRARVLDFPGRQWRAVFQARPSLIARTSSAVPVIILVGGLALNFLLFALLWLYARSERNVLLRARAEAERMTAELRDSEARFRSVVEVSPNGILLVDEQGRIEMANARAEQLFAYAPGALKGLDVELLVPQQSRAAHVGQRQAFQQAPSARQMGARREVSGLRQDGSEFLMSLVLCPVKMREGERTLVTVADITEQWAAEQREAATRRLLAGVIDAASEFSIIATDVDGLITVFNSGAQRMLGYSAEEMVGKQTPARIHDAEETLQRGLELSAEIGKQIEGFETFVHAARQGKAEAREWLYVHKNGHKVPVNLTVNAIPGASGEIMGFIGVAYDISLRRQTEHALAQARDYAEEANRSKSEFLSNMSHEIRTPLNAVLGMAQVLGFSQLDAEQRQQVRMIKQAGKALLSLLNDILDLSKIEAGRMELAQTPFVMQDVASAMAEIMQSSAADKDLSLSIEVAPDVPYSLLGDQARLQQILLNLVGNALKFTLQGEVNVQVKLSETRDDEVKLAFTVRDTGIGMSEEQIGRLFDAFSQADSSATRKFGGSGLGLVICRRLIELMHGQIGVHSVPGQGSVFRFVAWFKKVPEHLRVLPEQLNTLSVRDMLLVEANAAAADSMVSVAGALGVSCDVCASESEAMARVITRGKAHDLVLIDWGMPDRGRNQLVSQLQAKNNHPIVLAISSAFNRETFEADPLASMLDGVLIKPVTSSTVIDSVMQALAKRDNAKDLRKLMRVPELQLRARSLRGARLLLVEDNAINQMVARGILQQAGALIDAVGNGQEAVDTLRSHPNLYAMVLMDVQMPVMDGCTATRIIRAELKLSLPIVAMTAGVLSAQRAACMAAGMDEFLSKPLDASLTISTLERVLQGDSSPAPESAAAQPKQAIASASVQPPLEVEGLDHASALARIGGNRALYRELLLQFRIEAGSLPAETQAYLDKGALRDAGRGFHTLKSTAASIGSSTLSVLSQTGESAAQAEDIALAQETLRQIRAELERLLPAISRTLEQGKRSPAQAASASMGPDRVALEHLLAQLRSHDLDALDAFEYLREGLPGAFGVAEAERLTSLVSALDFDPAVQLLEQLMAGL